MEAIQTGKKIFFKPTQKQPGGALGTILASIGIPLAIEAKRKLTGKGTTRNCRPKKCGVPPPFIVTWKKQFGKGAPRMGKKWPKDYY